MWKVNGSVITMVEGDFGLALPITISGATFTAADEVRFTVKTAVNGNTVLEKVFEDILNNTASLELTEEESAALPVGKYVYCIDWYQDGVFLCNIVPVAAFEVVEKA